MKKLALSAIALTALCTAFVAPSHASPLPDGPVGQKCRFNSTTDVGGESGRQVGDVNAGPLVTAETGTLKCTIHVGNDVHNGAVVAGGTVTGDATAGVAVAIAPTVVNYPATAADDVSLCTEWQGASGTLYWVSVPAPGTGFWTPDATSHCGVALSIEPNDPECSIWLAIDQRAGTPIAETWQDCEGYQPII